MTEIILAAPGDFPRVRAFYHSLIDEMQSLPTFPGWEKDVFPTDAALLDYISQGEMHLLTVGGELAGAMALNGSDSFGDMCWPSGASDGGFSVVHLLAVHPRFGRRGLGRQLVGFALDAAREQGLKAVRLSVADNNTPAQRLYDSMGFLRVGDMTEVFDDGSSMHFYLCERPL